MGDGFDSCCIGHVCGADVDVRSWHSKLFHFVFSTPTNNATCMSSYIPSLMLLLLCEDRKSLLYRVSQNLCHKLLLVIPHP